MEMYHHQTKDRQFILATPRVLNFSDPGTGKTRTVIEAVKEIPGRVLVICPKSIMRVAWESDVKKFSGLEISIAEAPEKNRKAAFATETKIVVINHDGVKWVKDNKNLLKGFSTLVIDESTAFKNGCGRTTAAMEIAKMFDRRVLLSGTPYTNTILDVWRQVFICDDGKRLGKNFYKFRAEACKERILPNGIRIWEDKENIELVVASLLKDITIRRTLNECLDIPENVTTNMEIHLNKVHRDVYNKLRKESILALENGAVTALNAAVLYGKLLQVLSGAVYHQDGNYSILDTDRYELIAELAEERKQTVIAFNWRHQRDLLARMVKECAVIDGETPQKKREDLIREFQEGGIKNLLMHPRTGAHGITLTAGKATIWASPPASSEGYVQFNHRIHRAGQTEKTETIRISATETMEKDCYGKLEKRLGTAETLMQLLRN